MLPEIVKKMNELRTKKKFIGKEQSRRKKNKFSEYTIKDVRHKYKMIYNTIEHDIKSIGNVQNNSEMI